MPHAELKYSADLDFDAPTMLADIEYTILTHDAGSGACKGRAYPTENYHHTHLLVTVMLLTKPHRDDAFTTALLEDLEAAITAHLGQRCFFSLALTYSSGAYITNEYRPE